MEHNQENFNKSEDGAGIYKCPTCGKFCSCEEGFTAANSDQSKVAVFCSEAHVTSEFAPKTGG